VVRAASYEARAHGIRAGMPVTQAVRLCPQAAFIEGSYANYVTASNEVMGVLRRFADGGRIRQTSIDEAYLEVTERVQEYPDPKALALAIQQAVHTETDLPCSIGIAPNMAVAKIATGLGKPRGITLVPQDPAAVAQFLAPMSVDAIHGVGPATTRWLSKHGITTIEQIQRRSIAALVPIMGKGAKWLHDRAWGIDNRPLQSTGPRMRKSIGRDRTFMEDLSPGAIDRVAETVQDICKRIWGKLRAKSFYFRTITVKLRYDDYTTLQHSRSLNVSTDDLARLSRTALDLLEKNRMRDRRIRLVGVRVTNLTSMNGQLHLADYPPATAQCQTNKSQDANQASSAAAS
jgi:nucleotidyltransferase/DNA polymerase involved in DNA repair